MEKNRVQQQQQQQPPPLPQRRGPPTPTSGTTLPPPLPPPRRPPATVTTPPSTPVEVDIPPPPCPPPPCPPPAAAAEDVDEAKMARMRAHVLKEIIDTEEAYVADLAVLEDTVLARAREKRLLDDERINSLFPGIGIIRELNTVLLGRLKAGEPAGRSFAQLAGFMKMYIAYCVNVPRAEELLRQAAKGSSAFRAFVADVPAMPGMHGLGLNDFVIKPVQRLCRYPLLLRELLKHTPCTHADHADLLRAVDELSKTLDAVNESKRADEQCSRVVRYAQRLELGDRSTFITPTRRFLREATLRELQPDGTTTADATYVFFNDLVLRVRPAGSNTGASGTEGRLVLRSYIDRAMLLVAPVPGDPRCLLDILHLGVDKFTVVCASDDERAALIDLCETIMGRRVTGAATDPAPSPLNQPAPLPASGGSVSTAPRMHSASFSSGSSPPPTGAALSSSASASSTSSLLSQQQHARRAGKTPAEQFGLAPKLKALPPVPRPDEAADPHVMVLPFTCTDGLGDDCRSVRFDHTATSWDALLARIARKVGYPPEQRMRLAVRMPAGNIVQLTSIDDLLNSVPASGRLPEYLVSRHK